MHNLALDLQANGHAVSGSDDVIFEPAKSRLAQKNLLPAEEGWQISRISTDVEAVILGMHAKADNPELIKAKELGIPIYSFPEWVAKAASHKNRVVIAGSHGKTTTTAMLMHALAHAGLPFDYLVGSQVAGYSRMVSITENVPIMVIEGDEYLTSPLDPRPKFLHYQPHLLAITGIAWDHANVFPTFDNYVRQFNQLLESLPENTFVAYCAIDEWVVRTVEPFRNHLHLQGYGTPAYSIRNKQLVVLHADGSETSLKVFGKHNLQNMEAARTLANELGVDDNGFYAAMATFEGTAKRLETVQTKSGRTIYRDFAHAPSKVLASVAAVAEKHAGDPIAALFELHTFSSLKPDFIQLYKHSLNAIPIRAVLYDPEAAARKSDQPLSATTIQHAFQEDALSVLTTAEDARQWLAELPTDTVVLIMSSGNLMGLDINSLL